MTTPSPSRLRELMERATRRPWKNLPSLHGDPYRCVQIGDDTEYSTLELLPDDAALIVELVNHDTALIQALEENERLREALTECEDYFSDTADAEYLPGISRPVPNRSMRLLEVVRAALTEKP